MDPVWPSPVCHLSSSKSYSSGGMLTDERSYVSGSTNPSGAGISCEYVGKHAGRVKASPCSSRRASNNSSDVYSISHQSFCKLTSRYSSGSCPFASIDAYGVLTALPARRLAIDASIWVMISDKSSGYSSYRTAPDWVSVGLHIDSPSLIPLRQNVRRAQHAHLLRLALGEP